MKMSHISSSSNGKGASDDPTPYFAPEVLNPNTIHRLHTEYAASAPFKHAIVDKLFQDEILMGVKDECLSELSFTEKETDIYKVRMRRDSPEFGRVAHQSVLSRLVRPL